MINYRPGLLQSHLVLAGEGRLGELVGAVVGRPDLGHGEAEQAWNMRESGVGDG